jgi:hypothetical protein
LHSRQPGTEVAHVEQFLLLFKKNPVPQEVQTSTAEQAVQPAIRLGQVAQTPDVGDGKTFGPVQSVHMFQAEQATHSAPRPASTQVWQTEPSDFETLPPSHLVQLVSELHSVQPVIEVPQVEHPKPLAFGPNPVVQAVQTLLDEQETQLVMDGNSAQVLHSLLSSVKALPAEH